MNIRAATESDIQRLAEMNFQLIQDEGHKNSMAVPELRVRMADWLRSNYQSVLIELKCRAIGYALWRIEE